MTNQYVLVQVGTPSPGRRPATRVAKQVGEKFYGVTGSLLGWSIYKTAMRGSVTVLHVFGKYAPNAAEVRKAKRQLPVTPLEGESC